ncbi:MAG TPA: Ku protein [Pirellulales bacterium]|jgi:DNA end-binding protein Ku|nr:Ku protein [Pirellulales bacterium]
MARTKSRSTHRKTAKHRFRASWSGMLRFGMVTFPVQAFNPIEREHEIAFHQLHATCHNRIRHEKHCPVHGKVSNDEIVSGYEYAKGKYVEIEPEELDRLRTDEERALNIDAFVDPEQIDPIYFDGRMYYLAPNGAEAKEPYAVLTKALEQLDRWGIGQVVFSGRKQLALLRPDKSALNMALLNYAAEIRRPDEMVGDLPKVSNADKKLKLAQQLVESWTDDKFDFAHYVDDYEQQLRKLIDAKIEGRELVAPEEFEEPEVVNLMDSLKRSIARTKKPTPREQKAEKHTPRRGHRRRRAS